MAQKTTELLKKLEEGVQSLLSSDKYLEYLSFLSSFHQYSARNSLLIFLQCQERNITPSLLAPYREWQKRHRHVARGQKGIAVIAPHRYSKKKDDGTDEERLGFHLAYTYDVSQTEPDDERGEIPSICTRLEGDLYDSKLLDILVSISPVPVRFESIPGEANGYYSPSSCEIVIDNTNSEIHQVKTLLHELAHCFHRMMTDNYDDCSRADFGDCSDFDHCSRAVKEVVAESVSYVCFCRLNQFSEMDIDDSSSYSWGYLANWGSEDLKEFKTNLNLIQKISDQILSAIESKIDPEITKVAG